MKSLILNTQRKEEKEDSIGSGSAQEFCCLAENDLQREPERT